MKLILKLLKPFPRYDITNAKLCHKGPEFAHYVPTVIERSKPITIQYLRTAIHFSLRLVFEHYKILTSPIFYFLVVTSLTPNLVKKGLNLYITYK